MSKWRKYSLHFSSFSYSFMNFMNPPPPSIIRAETYHIEDIVRIRESAPANRLAPLSIHEIVVCLREFFVLMLGQETIGCFRLFPLQEYPNTLELGSLAVDPFHWWHGYSEHVLDFSEEYAEKCCATLIAVTDNPGLEKKFLARGWKESSHEYSMRASRSEEKRLYARVSQF